MIKKKVFLIILFSNVLFAQATIEELNSNAENLFENGNYFSAITEFKRVLFFDEQNKYSFDANYKIGLCYKQGAFFDEAIKYFSIAEKYSGETEKIFELKTQIIRCNILRRTTDRAIQLCDELINDTRFSTYINKINYWKGWAYIFADDWESAEKYFKNSEDGIQLKYLSQKVNREKLSVTFAKVISYILPGSGQIYAGNYFSGFLSLAWNIAAGYFTINSFLANRAFDGIVIGELAWLRFYKGNVENAEKIATQKNLELSNKTLKYLQEEYRGIKP